MKLAHSLSALVLSVALLGGFATPTFADVPKAPNNISNIDSNKNGRIEKEEYLTYMSAAFDELAGAKGYCTFEEVKEGFRRMNELPTP